MTLSAGQHLGPYLIEAQAGAGGMGEVYRARDTRLDRTVAIKVLPGSTAQNPDLKARFQREAKAISSLNHPNICTLYDIGHEDGVDYLVMEYLEGDSLADKVTAGGMDLNEVYDIAQQIADALDKAHRQGLVHRDLKPGNVMLTREGAKLLDFGLAKLHGQEGVIDGASGITQTTPLTGAGTIVGTIQYMAPEQLEGKEADARSDIFGFGALLYEMITGKRPFDGKSQAGVIAAIIERDPLPVSEIKPLVPPGLNRLVRKCLSKDPDARWQSARDLSDELRWISQSGSQAGVAAVVTARRKFKFRLAWVVAAIAAIIAVAGNLYWLLQPEEPQLVRRFDIYANSEVVRLSWPLISPDGRYIAYRGADSTNRSQIWLRPVDAIESYPLPGTENAGRPFWSPDSRYLGFMSSGQLKRVPVSGGPAQLLAEIPGGADGSWGSTGMILLDGSAADSIRAVSVTGGEVRAATTIDHEVGEAYHAWPYFLPDGDKFIYLASLDSVTSGAGVDYVTFVGALNSDLRVRLFATDSRVIYAPGYLVYERGGILLARTFDPSSLEVGAEATPLTDEILNRSSGNIGFSTSNTGVIVFETESQGVEAQIKVFDRNGRELETIGDPGVYSELALSPDESRIVFAQEDQDNQQLNLWVRDLRRGVNWRLTFSDESDFVPMWSPDGSEVFFNRGEIPNVRAFAKAADGSSEERSLDVPDSLRTLVLDVTADGSAFSLTTLSGGPNVVSYNQTTGEVVMVAATDFFEFGGLYSPNGKYMAYTSNESGANEIYVRRADGSGGKWQISTSGGIYARWSADGKELFYWEPDNDLMAVPVSTEGVFTVGVPQKLFRAQFSTVGVGYPRWDISADAERYYLPVQLGADGEAKFRLVENWVVDLESRR